MRIVIQIPCFNEQDTIDAVISDIRAAMREYDEVKILVVDDGSTDNTIGAVRDAGADNIARHSRNQGLARAYMTGLAASLNIGADVIVNTDGDNQYPGADIQKGPDRWRRYCLRCGQSDFGRNR